MGIALLVLVTLIIYLGTEVGDSGTPHLQGFVIFLQSQTLRKIQECLLIRGHYEPAHGLSKQAAEYCKKGQLF
jgi:Putative viral replication protein